ncbi:MAG: helix-turn-helix transcriptional regulator [Clostridia bacterium]|nr:helix-turn-helix transcriptional regulator [Clostridia bacterium]
MTKEQVKKIRLARGLEQQEFAEILGVSRHTVSFWETGVRNLSAKNIKKILEYCNKNNIKI